MAAAAFSKNSVIIIYVINDVMSHKNYWNGTHISWTPNVIKPWLSKTNQDEKFGKIYWYGTNSG